MKHKAGEVENTIPVLPVKDLRRSKKYYVQQLGFRIDWGESEDAEICQVSRDAHPIMLTQDQDLGSPACVWIGLASDALFKEFVDNGVQDIDGNILWLGTEPKRVEDWTSRPRRFTE